MMGQETNQNVKKSKSRHRRCLTPWLFDFLRSRPGRPRRQEARWVALAAAGRAMGKAWL